MTRINQVMAALVGIVIVLALVTGLTSGPGSEIASGFWQIVQTIINWLGTSLQRLAARTLTVNNSGRSLIGALIAFAVMLVVKQVRAGGTALIGAVLLAGVFGYVLYDPSFVQPLVTL